MRNWLRTWFRYHTGPQDDYGRIHLSSLSPERGSDFFPFVKNALRLVETYDTRRYRQIERHIRYIADGISTGGASYRHDVRAITVNLLAYRDKDWFRPDYDFAVAHFACSLIHETTHARIASRGIRYNPKTRRQIERLCFSEARRFAERLQAQGYARGYVLDSLAPPFEGKWEQWYVEFWKQSRWQRILKQLRLLRRTIQAMSKEK